MADTCRNDVRAPHATHRWVVVGSNTVCGDCDVVEQVSLDREGSKATCARGSVKIEHVITGHYEFHVWQDKGIGAPTRAYVCLSAAELREVGVMIGEMFPEAPDQVERKFGKGTD